MFYYKVREKEAVILERFGRFNKLDVNAGIHEKLPGKFLKVAARIPLDVQQMKIELQTKTNDNIFATVPTILHLQIVDAKKFHYNAADPWTQTSSKITAVMKQLTSSMEFAALYQARETLGEDVRSRVGAEIEEQYGIKIVDVIVDEPVAPPEVQSAYNNAKASEQVAVAARNAAQAQKQAAILRAEGRKEEQRLDGEGIAKQREAMFQNLNEQLQSLIAGGWDKADASKLIIKMMELDTLRNVGEHGNVIVTTTADKDPVTNMQVAARAADMGGKNKEEKAQQSATPKPKPPGMAA